MKMTMTMTRNRVMAFLLATTLSAEAAVPMNDQKVMEISVARKGLTRLSVKGDSIQDIFIYPLMVGDRVTGESIQLHKSGHVFIAPDGMKEPFYLTVITRKGQVQDLKLSPSVQKAAPLVLMLPASDENGEEAEKHSRQVLEPSLLAALQGILPRGFTPDTAGDLSIQQRGGLTLSPKIVYRSQQYHLSVFELENEGDRDIALMPEQFLSPDDLAVVFERPVLTPHEKARMVILGQLQPRPLSSPRESSVSEEPLRSTLPIGKNR